MTRILMTGAGVIVDAAAYAARTQNGIGPQ